jgi:hypothetical protein
MDSAIVDALENTHRMANDAITVDFRKMFAAS